MIRSRPQRLLVHALGLLVALCPFAVPLPASGQATRSLSIPDGVFRSGVDLVSVSVTVLDPQGRPVRGLEPRDFVVEEDGVPQRIAQFSAGHVPVSVGIALDTSASMAGEKLSLAKRSLDSLLNDLFDPENEFLLYGFNDRPTLLQDWTRDRSAVMLAADRSITTGRTSLLDVVADAVPRVRRGPGRKTALIVVSDGHDNSSTTSIERLKATVQASHTLIYAIGVDCGMRPVGVRRARPHQVLPPPRRFRFPSCLDSVDVSALRELTDLSGGRTEIVDDPSQLEAAAKSIAAELTEQYFIGYPSPAKKDGRWHSIRVTTRNPALDVRARAGYLAQQVGPS